MALTVLVLQASDGFSATTVTLQKQGSSLYPSFQDTNLPHMLVYLAGSGQEYAGVLSGKVGSEGDNTTKFFCIDLTQVFPIGVSTAYTETTISGVTTLSDKQKCLLGQVYASLGITDVATSTRWFSDGSTAQDLSGTTTQASKLTIDGGTPLVSGDGLSNARAAAAQLVMWEIIHDFSSITSSTVSNPASLLTSGSRIWYEGYQPNNITPILFDVNDQIYNEFNSIAGAALTLCPVPEITSPVALLAGGLLFVRRRERCGTRLKKRDASSNSEIVLTA